MFFLKHATESSFLISIGVLFHSLVAETAKERPPSDSLLYLGQTALMLEYLVLREGGVAAYSQPETVCKYWRVGSAWPPNL